MRDKQTEEVKRAIEQGCKIKMDDSGNILVKRIAKEKVYVKQTSEENAIATDILKLPNGSLEAEKPVKLFDMKKFQQNVSREMRRAYPDRRKLECQCISAIAFVRNEQDILDSPCWIMLINIVAMDMLKSKMPSPPSQNVKNSAQSKAFRLLQVEMLLKARLGLSKDSFTSQDRNEHFEGGTQGS